jgi:hypothetical protein
MAGVSTFFQEILGEAESDHHGSIYKTYRTVPRRIGRQ